MRLASHVLISGTCCWVETVREGGAWELLREPALPLLTAQLHVSPPGPSAISVISQQMGKNRKKDFWHKNSNKKYHIPFFTEVCIWYALINFTYKGGQRDHGRTCWPIVCFDFVLAAIVVSSLEILNCWKTRWFSKNTHPARIMIIFEFFERPTSPNTCTKQTKLRTNNFYKSCNGNNKGIFAPVRQRWQGRSHYECICRAWAW